MRTVTKLACLMGLGLLCAVATSRAQSWYEEYLAECKAKVAELQMQTESLDVMGKHAERIQRKMLRLLSSAQAGLQVDAKPDTIYKAGISVYKYLRELYKLYRWQAISEADFMMLDAAAQEAFNCIMYLYWNHPAWGP